MFKKILVPLDGSETAEKVIPYVIDISHTYEASIVLLRIIPQLRSALKTSPLIIDKTKSQIESTVKIYIDEVIKRLRIKDLDVEGEIIWGSPAVKIIDFAASAGCDLIILGSHGENKSFHWSLGSISTKVIRSKKSMPVLIVPTNIQNC